MSHHRSHTKNHLDRGETQCDNALTISYRLLDVLEDGSSAKVEMQDAVDRLERALREIRETKAALKDHSVAPNTFRETVNDPVFRDQSVLRDISVVPQRIRRIMKPEYGLDLMDDEIRLKLIPILFYSLDAWHAVDVALWHITDSLIEEAQTGLHPLPDVGAGHE